MSFFIGFLYKSRWSNKFILEFSGFQRHILKSLLRFEKLLLKIAELIIVGNCSELILKFISLDFHSG